MSRIHYTKPSITELEVAYATDAARNGWGERCYEYIERFEGAFAAHLGVKHAIATSSCTGALHMGLAALGIGPGDEVILGDINWIASAAPITYLGATPVFVDVLEDSWCLDPARVEAAITVKTKAIIAVHLYGNLCDMDALLDIGQRHGLPVIEDAAEAIGSRIGARRAGSMGAFGTFSFHGTKTMTTGEGGMWVTNDDALFETVTTLSHHGRSADQPRQFWPEVIGYKYKMSNVQAAIGCAQLERIDALVRQKRELFQRYKQHLAHLKVSMNPEPRGHTNGYWMPTIVIDRSAQFDRQNLLAQLGEANIDGRVMFAPLSQLPMFTSQPNNSLAHSISERGLNLPSYHDMDAGDLHRVVSVLSRFIPLAGSE